MQTVLGTLYVVCEIVMRNLMIQRRMSVSRGLDVILLQRNGMILSASEWFDSLNVKTVSVYGQTNQSHTDTLSKTITDLVQVNTDKMGDSIIEIVYIQKFIVTI